MDQKRGPKMVSDDTVAYRNNHVLFLALENTSPACYFVGGLAACFDKDPVHHFCHHCPHYI